MSQVPRGNVVHGRMRAPNRDFDARWQAAFDDRARELERKRSELDSMPQLPPFEEWAAAQILDFTQGAALSAAPMQRLRLHYDATVEERASLLRQVDTEYAELREAAKRWLDLQGARR